MGCFLAPSPRSYKREIITDGTPFSSAHAYKAKGGGSCLRCGIAKKPKATKDQVLWPGAKKHPTVLILVYNYQPRAFRSHEDVHILNF